MSMDRPLLVATDFSPDSRHAAGRALLLPGAQQKQAITLLHVIERSVLSALKDLLGGGAAADERLRHEAGNALAAMISERGEAARERMQPALHPGDPAQVIAEQSAAHSLLLLGSRGRHPMREMAMGTTAQRLVRRLHKPVLVVRQPYRHVLAAVDFSPHAAAGLKLAQQIAPEARLHVLHVLRPLLETELAYAGVASELIEEYREQATRDARNQMRDFLVDTGLDPATVSSQIGYGYPPEILQRELARSGAELLVVGKHGRSLTEELLLGSITQHALAKAPCDVLVAVSP